MFHLINLGIAPINILILPRFLLIRNVIKPELIAIIIN